MTGHERISLKPLPYSTKVSRDKTFVVRSPCEYSRKNFHVCISIAHAKVSRDKTFVVRSPCEFEKLERLHQKRPLLDLLMQSVTALIH